MDASPRVVGFLGPEGTFSQEAALLYRKRLLPGIEVEYRQAASILELILAAAEDRIDEAVVPLENSLEGSAALTLICWPMR